MKIGVLALQGGVIEHIKHIKRSSHEGVEVKSEKDLEGLNGIILPGGESTTMGKLLNVTGLMKPLKDKIKNGLPTWGTCAGMILLAKEIENDDKRHLELMNISVKRNAFGTQIDSFKTLKLIKEVSNEPIELVFIRAPYITEVGENVSILSTVEGNVVAAFEKNMLVTSFHPELTDDTRFFQYFINGFCKEF